MEIKTVGVDNPFVSNSQKVSSNNKDAGIEFSSLLNDALGKVNDLQLESNEYKKLLAIGEVDNMHDVTIASEKANISLQLTLSIRNKVIEAYQEIMRMQI